MGGRGAGGGGGGSSGARAIAALKRSGLVDARLDYLRGGMREMAGFHKAFADARARGVSATKLAASGKFFGKSQPIRIDIFHNGQTSLSDGRHRYTAARAAGATRIRAQVTVYGPRGGIQAQKTVTLPLR